jgi:hypothetical protein
MSRSQQSRNHALFWQGQISLNNRQLLLPGIGQYGFVLTWVNRVRDANTTKHVTYRINSKIARWILPFANQTMTMPRYAATKGAVHPSITK